MKAILQRVASASVTVDAQLISSIGKGILVFAAVAPDDTAKEIESMVTKVLRMKMWPDEQGATFTLLASTKKGSKPDFHGAAGGEKARELYDHFVEKVRDMYEREKVKDGVFQAMMQVNLQNDGPVTLEIQTNPTTTRPKSNRTSEVKEETKSEFQIPAELLE
ncbi:MAG: hypothetical protein Q9222_003476 [Ikaeria aurantiellina]